jgi:hypothetical protein
VPNATPNLGGLRAARAYSRLYFNGRTAPSAGAGLPLSRPSLAGAALPTGSGPPRALNTLRDPLDP